MTHATALETDGYAVVEGALDAAALARVRRELGPVVEGTPFGRNDFEGFHTRRAYALLARAPGVADLVEHPAIMELASQVLAPGYLLSALLAIDLHPDETAQALHYDDGFYRVPRPRPAIGLSTIWALDDFVTENGATEVVPGSHKLGEEVPTEEDVLAVEMPAGSVLVMLGTLWHRGGANRTTRPRLAVTAQYCEPWARQQEQMMVSVPPPVARTLTARLQDMLGYSVHPPFMGHVAGMHPRRLLDGDHDPASDGAADAARRFWDDPRAAWARPGRAQ